MGELSAFSINGLCISPDSRLWVATRVSEAAIWLPNCATLTVSEGVSCLAAGRAPWLPTVMSLEH